MSLLIVAMATAGCVGSGDKDTVPPVVTPPVDVKDLLGFAQEVLIDGEHRGGEPSIAVDSKGTIYVSAPSGFVSTLFNSVIDPTIAPAQGPQNRQSFLWTSADAGATWKIEAIDVPMAPDGLTPLRPGDTTFGGADTDVVVDACDNVYFTDLWLGNIAVSVKRAGEALWRGTPITGIAPVLDRQWLAIVPGDQDACGTVYLAFQTFYEQVWVIKSTDYGLTWPQQTLVMDCRVTPSCYAIDGNLVVDAKTKNVYLVLGGGGGLGTQVAVSKDGGSSFTVHQSSTSKGNINNIFPVIATDYGGNVYVVWSSIEKEAGKGGSYNVHLVASVDQGTTWSEPIVVSGDPAEGTEVFPWVAAGAEGRVAVAWIGVNETLGTTDEAKGDWYVYLNLGLNVTTPNATWTGPARMSEQPMHKGEICTLGLTCTLPQPIGTRGNRNLADFFEITVNVDGRVIASWPNDVGKEEQFVSFAYFGKQEQGPKLFDVEAIAAAPT